MSAIRDEDGLPIRPGDYITFSFGIPPISVLCRVTSAGGPMQVECLDPPDVKPRREALASVMKWYQVWKAPKARIEAYNRDYRKAPHDPQA